MAGQTQQIWVIIESDEGQILIDIMNDHGLEKLVNFPTREKKIGLNFDLSSWSVCRHSFLG